MKNLTKISLLIYLVSFGVTLFAEPKYYKKFDVHFSTQSPWTLKSKKRNLTLTHSESLATINIISKTFLEPVTANRLYQERAMSKYDGWLNIVSRESNPRELTLSNADEGHIAVYVHQELTQQLKLQELLTGEYYFIKDNRYYIVTIITSKRAWPRIQKDWKNFLDSFWVGSDAQPLLSQIESSLEDWVGPGNTGNSAFIEASPAVTSQLDLNWERHFSGLSNTAENSFIIKDGALYVLHNEILEKINHDSGETIWNFKIVNSDIQYTLKTHASLLFLTPKDIHHPILVLSAQTGEVIYRFDRTKDMSPLTFFQDYGLINNNGVLEAYSLSTGKLAWKKKLRLKPNSQLIQTKDFIIGQLSSGELAAIDPQELRTLWKTRPCLLTRNLSINRTSLFATIKEGKSSEKIVAFSLTDGSIQWSFNKAILNFKLTQDLAVSEKNIIITATILGNADSKRHILAAINSNSGKLEWEHMLTAPIKRPLLTSSYIYTLNKDLNEHQIYDLITGERLPHGHTSSRPEHVMAYRKQLIYFYKSSNGLTIKTFG